MSTSPALPAVGSDRMTRANAHPLSAEVVWPDAARRAAFEHWLASLLTTYRLEPATLRPASADASFRRYLRIDAADRSFVIMDAPPPQEDVRPFVQVAGLIGAAGLHAPQVQACDDTHGFLLLSDLGARPYLAELQAAVASDDTQRIESLMRDAFAALVQWQMRVDANDLPAYDDALLRRELALFPEWCVGRERGIAWTDSQQAQWQSACDILVASAL
ncbi:MAG: phosphotransferase, partial [Burkholderiales bacterium]